MQKIVANEELSQQDGMPKVIALDGKKHRGAQDQDLHWSAHSIPKVG